MRASPAARSRLARRLVAAGALLACTAVTAGTQDGVFADGFESLPCPLDGGTATVAMPQLVATLSDSFHEAWLGSPSVADLTGDGSREIIAARSRVVVGWHSDGQIVFKTTVAGSRIWASPVVADIVTSAAGLEVAVASADSIYLWNAAGQAMPGFPKVVRNELRSLSAGDIDGDGDLELVVATTNRLDANGQRDILFAYHHDGAAVTGFPPNTSGAAGCTTTCFVTGSFDQGTALGNMDADLALEVASGQDNAYLSLHDGDGRAFDAANIFNNRNKFSGIRFMHDYALAQQGFADDEATDLQAHFTNSAPVFADVDGNGTNELVVLGSAQNAAQTQRMLGVGLFAVRSDGTRPSAWTEPFYIPTYLAGLVDYAGTNIVAATNQIAVADIAADRAGQEFVFAGFDGRIHAIDSARSEVWSHEYTTDARVLTAGVAIADLSRDGMPEIVFATYSPDAAKSNLIVLSATGARLHTVPLADRGSMAVPTIADADGDGLLEIIVNLKDAVTAVRQVVVYEVAGSSGSCLLWPTGRGSDLRNGSRLP